MQKLQCSLPRSPAQLRYKQHPKYCVHRRGTSIILLCLHRLISSGSHGLPLFVVTLNHLRRITETTLLQLSHNDRSGLEIKLECTRELDAVCQPLDGFYCVDQVADGCIEARKHKDCQPGQYISQKGTPFSDTVCNDCIGETFSNGTITFCHPHRKCDSQRFVRRPGNASTDAECLQKRSRVGSIVIILVDLIVVVTGCCYIFTRKQTAKEIQLESTPIQTCLLKGREVGKQRHRRDRDSRTADRQTEVHSDTEQN
ncbi:tumor necrosis factor receptor superfamily member 14-like isoform X3 [Syngnathus acus]|uniref:tumor necrosis factor receptor superfamily member 14-like isoform X3 n=1 Tax=Syngnathus acus TaxID=161584 RepID=UPI001886005E|nr:tumor necrosis factor receptor superfamily member 14-like isoform X3 [Syngnathus acus]XP_037101948.1 tumor necrosis factor receptor superfamily member 14-like isoform X3 [Syngnathus acus]